MPNVTKAEKDLLKSKFLKSVESAQTIDSLQEIVNRRLFESAQLESTPEKSDQITVLAALATPRHETADTAAHKTEGNLALTQSVQDIFDAIHKKYQELNKKEHKRVEQENHASREYDSSVVDFKITEKFQLEQKLMAIPHLKWAHTNLPDFWQSLANEEGRNTMKTLLPLATRKEVAISICEKLHANITSANNIEREIAKIQIDSNPFKALQNYLTILSNALPQALAVLSSQDSAIHAAASTKSLLGHLFKGSVFGSSKTEETISSDLVLSAKSLPIIEKFLELAESLFTKLKNLMDTTIDQNIHHFKNSFQEILDFISESKENKNTAHFPEGKSQNIHIKALKALEAAVQCMKNIAEAKPEDLLSTSQEIEAELQKLRHQ